MLSPPVRFTITPNEGGCAVPAAASADLAGSALIETVATPAINNTNFGVWPFKLVFGGGSIMTDDERLAAYEQCVRDRYGPSSHSGVDFLTNIFMGNFAGAVNAWVQMVLRAPKGDDTCANVLTEAQKAQLAEAVRKERENRKMDKFDKMPR